MIENSSFTALLGAKLKQIKALPIAKIEFARPACI